MHAPFALDTMTSSSNSGNLVQLWGETMFFVYALSGALAASVLACIPALHVYNVVGLLLALNVKAGSFIGPEALSALMLGLITGYAMLNAIPSIFLSVPEESTVFVILPGQKYLRQRRGWEAALLTGVGGLGGVIVLVLWASMAGFPVVRLVWVVTAVVSPTAVLAVLCIMNSSQLLGKEIPRGHHRIAWNTSLAGTLACTTAAAIYALWSLVG